MTRLGVLCIDSPEAFNEARRKVLRLAAACGFDEIEAGRLASIFSGLTRPAPGSPGASAAIDLTPGERGPALAFRFGNVSRSVSTGYAARFFDSFSPLPPEASPPGFFALKHLPGQAFEATATFIEAQRDMLARPSREELLLALELKNSALEREVIERRLTEEALRSSEARIQAVLEGTPDSLIIVDGVGTITYVNSQTEKTFGYDRSELLGKPIELLIPAESRPGHAERVRSFFREGRTREMGMESNLYAQAKDGRRIAVDLKLSPMMTETGPQVIASIRDVTQQKQALELVKKLSLVVEQSPVSVAITDRTGVIEYVNPAFCSTTGYLPEEVIGQNPRLLRSEKTPPEVYKDMWETINAGKIWKGLFINRKKDGRDFWESTAIAPIFNQQNEITHFAAVKEDITERIRSEEEIKRQRALLDTLINSLPLVIYSKDRQGLYQVANDSLCELVGRPREEIIGKTAHDLFARDVADSIIRGDKRTLDHMQTSSEEDWRTYPDGRKALLHMTRVPLRDDDGQATGLVGVLTDITERKKAQDLIRQSEIKYRELVETAKSIILKLDMDGNITFFNEFAQRFFGFSQEEILGRPIVGSIVPYSESGGRDLKALLKEIVRNPERYEKNENENVCKDGARVWVSWTNQVVKDEVSGQPKELLCIGLDATERKKAQDGLHDALEVISGSIRYASRIQRAILPASDAFAQAFSSHFILWNPRDVVGGDIYWSAKWGEGSLFVLGDCTGHGVPGAFMTLISTGALSQALTEVPPGNPGLLMRRAHQIVQSSLNQHVEGGDSDDGMELGICYVEPGAQEMLFVGARFPLFIDDGGEIVEIKADKKGIGYRGIPYEQEFSERRIALRPGLRMYMVSDGVFDQIGGEKRRGFGKNRFKEVLLSLAEIPFEQHGQHIYDALLAHQGSESRRDDVSIMGLEY